jgi:7-keto-8-aminopelargonate synthetase-like enzyme
VVRVAQQEDGIGSVLWHWLRGQCPDAPVRHLGFLSTLDMLSNAVYKWPGMIEPEPLQQIERTYVRLGRRKLSYFSGCDYFRMASHPEVMAALEAGARRYGLNVAASRLTTGNHHLYRELEGRLARFFGAESALVVPTGYMADLIAAQALAGDFSHALIDAASHFSLLDAARFLDCPLVQFKHRDAADLGSVVRRCGAGAKLLLLTDGMFSRDGSAAPLADYLEVLPKDAVVLVDDAHGGGVLGRTGKGALEHAGVRRDRRLIQTVTLSKAFGTYGGAILATAAFRQRVLDRSALFIGSTPLPLPLANAALRSIEILATDQGLRKRLARNQTYLKDGLRTAGWPLPETPGPIATLTPELKRQISRLKQALLAAGIYPPMIKYPGSPANGYFRFAISSEHSREQLDAVIEAAGSKQTQR